MPTNKYFACPFCKDRFTKEDMIKHVEKKHESDLPEGFTPLRVVFHAANRKDLNYRRPCRICRKPTEWDENKGRYNFLCENPACKKAWIENMKDTMGDKYGAYRPTESVEGLEKMLASRRISGKYKFSSGGEVPYTGTYEKKALEFMDHVLGVKFEDIEVPGPAIKYTYRNRDHIYIPDIYYRPYNLIIEIKDGGRNPNKHPGFSENRAKKIAKENYVIKHTNYNYLRLTDNNFAQLLAVFADLKFHLVNDDRNKVSHVNESTINIAEHMGIGAVNPVVGFTPGDAIILAKPMNRVFAVTDSPNFEKAVTINHQGILGFQKKEDLGDDYKTYVMKDRLPNVEKALKDFLGKELSESKFYELVFGHPQYSKDQLLFEDVIPLSDIEDKITQNIIESTVDYILEDTMDQYKSTFLSENDFKYNYNGFLSGKSDVLFISGIETKGKSEDVESIADQFGADVIHLDDIQKNYLYSDKKLREKHILIYKYFTDTEEGIEERRKNKKKDPEVDLYETIPNFLQFFLANREPNKKYIIEGPQLIELLAAGRIKFDILEKYSIIFKDTSFLQTKMQTDDIQSREKIFNLMSDYIDFIKDKVKLATFENLPNRLKKKVENDKPLKDIVKDALGEATDMGKPVVSDPYFIKSSDGVDNACVDIQGYDHPCRGRSSMLILKFEDGEWKVFLSKDEEKDHEYHAPGGGWNKGESPKDAAIREAQEEVYINVKDVKYEGYLLEYHEEVQDWVREHVSDPKKWWYGYYSEIYVGIYDSKFTGKVDDRDKDQMANSGKWYNFKDIKDTLTPEEYREAIENYIMSSVNEDWTSPLEESQDMSKLDKDHTAKEGYTFKYIDLESPEAEKYIKANGGIKEWRNRSKKAELAICNETDEIAGFIYVKKENGSIGPLKVLRKYRGYGISDKLLEDAIDKFDGKELGVYKDNEIALKLYNSHGFKVKEDHTTWQKMIKESYNDMNIESKYLEESDISQNTDKWNIGNNILFITGLTGSGKTTLAKDIRENYESYLINLDNVSMYYHQNYSNPIKHDKVVKDLQEGCPYIMDFFNTHNYTANSSLRDTDNIQRDFCNWFIENFSDTDKLYIIEGDLLPYIYPSNWFNDKPIIIKNNTYENICMRRASRNYRPNTEASVLESATQVQINNKKLRSYYNEMVEFTNAIISKKEQTIMDKYTQVLEFFISNGVYLDSDQRNNLKTIIESDGLEELIPTREEYYVEVEMDPNEDDDYDVFTITEDDTIDLTGDLEFPLLEITEEDLKKNITLSPVFVMLSFNGSVVGKVIKGYGKDLGWEYSHSSISLLPSLSTLYSFNIVKTTDEEGKKHKYNGLAIEHFRDFKNNPKCKIKVIAILVDVDTKSKIRQAIQYYVDNIKKTKYAAGSLAKALFGTGAKIQNYGNMTLFCSQFVDAILKQANIDIGGRGSSVNTHPSELGQFKDKNNYFTVYEGKASEYNEDLVENKINYMKQTMTHKDLNAITDRTDKVHVDDHKVENRAKQYIERKVNKLKERKNDSQLSPQREG